MAYGVKEVGFAANRLIALGVIGAAGVGQALLCSVGKVQESIVTCVAAFAIVTLLCSPKSPANKKLIDGDRLTERLLLLWFVTTPLASFYVRFPAEQSLLTFDRLVIATVSIVLLVYRLVGSSATHGEYHRATEQAWGAGFRVTPFEACWAALTAVVLVNVAVKSHNLGYSLRIALDSFALPLVAFHLARSYFDLERRGREILLGAMALSFFLLSCGAVEIATGWNLFPYKGSLLVRAAEVRVNGPFASDSSYAIISLLLGLFLLEAPRMLRLRLNKGARLIFVCAVTAALVSSCLPLYRVVPLSLVVCVFLVTLLKRWTLDESQQTFEPRRVRTAWKPVRLSVRSLFIPSMIAVAAAAAMYILASTNARLASPENAFSRLATWQAALRIAVDHPLSGVGLSNYSDYLKEKYGRENWSVEEALETRIATAPHSNVLWIAAEVGLPGLVPYLLANVFLAGFGIRTLQRAKEPHIRAGAACYLSLIVAYWVPGLTLTSGAYSDLNLYFLFLLGLLSGFLRRATR